MYPKQFLTLSMCYIYSFLFTSCETGDNMPNRPEMQQNRPHCEQWGKIIRISRLSPNIKYPAGQTGYVIGKSAASVYGNGATSLAGGLVVGTIAHFTQETAGIRDRLRMTIQLDSGEKITVEQKIKWGEGFTEGDRVRITGTNAVTH